MTRMRDGKSDWQTFSARKRREHLAGAGELYGGARSAEPVRSPKPRSRPVQWEQAEAEALFQLAAPRWWSRYITRIEHRTADWREAGQRQREGARTGMPDVWVLVPACLAVGQEKPPILAVVELKRPTHRPKRAVADEWWLDLWPGEQRSWHGLRRDQHQYLGELAGCGFETLVAYSAHEAFEWLDRLCSEGE